MNFKITNINENDSETKYLDNIPDFVQGIIELYSSIDLMDQIKDIKFYNKEILDKKDINSFDAFYFITREKLLNIKSDICSSFDISFDKMSSDEKLFFKDLFSSFNNFSTIKISTEKDPSEISLGYINYILYSIISQTNKISDIETIYHFIDNHYESRFSDLILKYSLKNSYRDIILADINPVVFHEYETQEKDIPSIDYILTLNSTEIEKFYKLIWNKKSLPNKNNLNLQLIKSEKATSFMITDYLIRNELKFVKQEILGHPSCPNSILKLSIAIEEFIPYALSNKQITEEFLLEIYNSDTIYNDLKKIYQILMLHDKCSKKLSLRIEKDLKIMKEEIYYDISLLEDFSPNMQMIILEMHPELNPIKLKELNKKNINYDNFNKDIIKSNIENYSLKELLEISSYAKDYFDINQLIVKKIGQANIGEITDVINTLDETSYEEVIFKKIAEDSKTCSKDEGTCILNTIKNNESISLKTKDEIILNLELNPLIK
jgi:hypothetical protein